jgi:surfactin family lipopeptide synthetase C
MELKNVEDAYPLAPTQHGILFHNLYDPGSAVYFEIITWTIHGEVNIEAFEKAWQSVVDRHPILRTVFVWEGLDEPLQVVRKQVKLPLRYEDWRGLTPEVQQEKVEEFFARERARGFDLSAAPLMRIALIQLEDNVYRFVWSYHHVMIDGWSLSVIFDDVFNFYETLAQGQELKIEPGRPFRDYINWVRKQDLSEAETFWRRTLQGFVEPTVLGVGNGKSSETHTHAEEQLYLSTETSNALQAFARRHQLTLNTLFQGAWAILLNRYSNARDIVFGVAVSGRPLQLPKVKSMVGMLVNTLPARIEVRRGATLLPWLKQIQEQQVTMRKYEYTSLLQIQQWSDVPNRMQLFDSIMVFENHPIDSSLGRRSAKAELRDIIHYTAPGYPLNVIIEPGKELRIRIIYDVGRFEAAAVRRMLSHFQQLLENSVANADAKLDELEMLTPGERSQLLDEWHGSRTAYPRESCIQELFEAEVERAPEAVAVIFGEQRLTYRELNERANQLAHHLRGLGVGPEVLVGLCVKRSLELIVGLLGILKAGGAYVPLDPSYPAGRLAFMLEDSAAPVLVTKDALVNTLPPSWSTVVCLDTDWDKIAASSTENPVNQNSADSLAYLIYTSGSTGQPKGVLNLQRGAVNRFHWMWEKYPFEAGEVCCQKTSLNFVDSVWEIFGPLLQGIPLVIIPDEIVKDTVRLVDMLSRKDITRITVVPSLLQMMLNLDIDLQARLSKLKYWTTSGEVLTQELLETFQTRLPEAVLLNLYGSSEVAADVTSWEMGHQHDRATVGIGSPIANTRIYLLNSYLQLVPVGVAGELYVSGPGLARGYHKRPDLTAERFIPSPFGPAGERLYRSGDFARYRPDGTIDYLGRTDRQVKLRGFRIELGEVEAMLRDHDAVSEAVVVVREDKPGDKRLVAYVVPVDPTVEVTSQLRSYMKAKLPDYMVPALFVQLEEFKLTESGKINRQSLPVPDQSRPVLQEEFVAPRNQLEESLAQIWCEILELERVGIHDNFFDVGGNSLLAMQIIAKVTNTFEVHLPLYSLFDTPTIAGLAQQIELAGQAGQDLQEIM